jgi:SAM-dependent methyltransferase
VKVDYERVAPGYDRRYAERSYRGVEEALTSFLEGAARDALEVGCGTGHWLERMSAAGHRAVGVDASPAMVRRARAACRARVAVATAEALAFAAARFDAVVCVNAFHHFPDKHRFLAEAWRVLRPGGRFFSVGMDPHGGVRKWVIYDFFPGTWDADRIRFPAPAAIRSWLAAAGFAEAATTEAERMDDEVAGRAALASPFLERRGTSQLALLDDAAYAAGIRRIEAEVARAEARGEQATFAVQLSLYATTATKPVA